MQQCVCIWCGCCLALLSYVCYVLLTAVRAAATVSTDNTELLQPDNDITSLCLLTLRDATRKL
jgi:hypothetical protein